MQGLLTTSDCPSSFLRELGQEAVTSVGGGTWLLAAVGGRQGASATGPSLTMGPEAEAGEDRTREDVVLSRTQTSRANSLSRATCKPHGPGLVRKRHQVGEQSRAL